MTDRPFTFTIPYPSLVPTRYDNHIQRRLSAMKDQFSDEAAYQEMLSAEDTLVYEVYEITRPPVAGEVLHGLSIIHPGKVGREFFMTKGHFHAVIQTAEVYLCLNGEGFMVMEHRSVNTSPNEDLVTFFVYPGNAGHDYGTIETQGFRKLVVERNGVPVIVDNPRWMSPEKRA